MEQKNNRIPELRFPEFVNDGEWEVNEVGNIFEITRGYVLSMSMVNDYQTNENPYPVYSSQTKNNGLAGFYKNYLYENAITWTTDGANAGDVNYRNGKFYCTNVCGVLISKEGFANKCISEIINSVAKNYVSYVGNPKLMNGVMSKIKIPVPKIKEQQKIADCLTSLDELITAHSDKLENLKSHKKGLLQNLFPQENQKVPTYRFPEFPDSYQKIGFSELGNIKIGLTHKPDYIKSGVPFLSSKNISKGYIDFENIHYISFEKFKSMPESTKPKIGDILFTRVGSNLGNPIVLEENIEFGIFVSLGAFRVNNKAHNYYIKYWMESDLFWKQLNQKVAGGAKDNLNSTWLREFELDIPSVVEQQKIAECLLAVDQLITAQTEKIEQLKNHKKGLMQGLFPKIEN